MVDAVCVLLAGFAAPVDFAVDFCLAVEAVLGWSAVSLFALGCALTTGRLANDTTAQTAVNATLRISDRALNANLYLKKIRAQPVAGTVIILDSRLQCQFRLGF